MQANRMPREFRDLLISERRFGLVNVRGVECAQQDHVPWLQENVWPHAVLDLGDDQLWIYGCCQEFAPVRGEAVPVYALYWHQGFKRFQMKRVAHAFTAWHEAGDSWAVED